MLKHVHDLKKDLREKGWWERDSPEVFLTSFLRSENSDAELGFKFDWISFNLVLYKLRFLVTIIGSNLKPEFSQSQYLQGIVVEYNQLVEYLSTPTSTPRPLPSKCWSWN